MLFSSVYEFWKLTRPFKRQLTVVSILLGIDALLTAFSVVTIAPLADLVLEKPHSQWLPVTSKLESLFELLGMPFTLVSMTLLFFILTLSMAIFSVVVRRELVRLKISVIRYLIDQSLEKMFAADWGYFSATKRGVLNNTYINEINKSANAFQGLTQGISAIVKIIAFIIVPLILEPVLVSICLIATLIMVLPFMYIGKWSFLFGSRDLKFVNRYSSILRESIEAAREVISYGKESETIAQINQAYKKSGEAQIKSATFSAFATQMYEPVGILIIITVLIFARQSSEDLALSSIAVVLWGLIRTIGPIKLLIQIKHNIDNKLPSLQQVFNEQARAESYSQTLGKEYSQRDKRRIEFHDVTFTYQGNSRGLLGCSFSADDNQLIALVGESGSGKSTIIDLVLGLQRPASGSVLLNGIDSRSIDLNIWRAGISLVPQKPVLFDLSVRDNLLWANSEATESELWHACEVADAKDFINQLPNGLDTEIGDSGIRLSGGQVQRIALARAIIRKPDLLILDEATSALDMETEARIYKALEKETDNCLVFIVAHRLSTISNADRILVFQQGRLIEQGNYQSLLNQHGYFRRLLNSQRLPDGQSREGLESGSLLGVN
ncbi:MAG: ABC transporter ATP-binding protein [bacterium]